MLLKIPRGDTNWLATFFFNKALLAKNYVTTTLQKAECALTVNYAK